MKYPPVKYMAVWFVPLLSNKVTVEHETNLLTMNSFDFRYESTGFGNAIITMVTDEQSVRFDASYIGKNPLGDLLGALADMKVNQEDKCFLTWQSEPGTLRTEIHLKNGLAHLLVYESRDLFSSYDQPDDDLWQKKIDAEVLFQDIVDVVVKEAERNLKLHGISGFSTDWMSHCDIFPMSAYLILRGINPTIGLGDLRYSSLEEEMRILQTHLQRKGALTGAIYETTNNSKENCAGGL